VDGLIELFPIDATLGQRSADGRPIGALRQVIIIGGPALAQVEHPGQVQGALADLHQLIGRHIPAGGRPHHPDVIIDIPSRERADREAVGHHRRDLAEHKGLDLGRAEILQGHRLQHAQAPQAAPGDKALLVRVGHPGIVQRVAVVGTRG